MFTLTPSQDDVQAVVRAFLLYLMPPGTEVVQAQDNRVPEPESTSFIVITALNRQRIETNITSYLDAAFTGSVVGDTLTVSAVRSGVVAVGSPVYGSGVALGTRVTALGSGTGGTGTYLVSPVQSIGSEVLAAGAVDLLP